MFSFRSVVCLVALALLAAPRVVGQERTQPAPTLAAVFNTGANLGFAAIRAGYAPPDQPPPQAALDWMVRDFDNAKRWSALVQSCIAFNASRFDDAAALVQRRATARELWTVTDALYRDYQTAVRGSTCNFGLPTPQALETFFVGSVFTGFATARASYFNYPTALPPEVAAQIRQDFAAIRSSLPASAACTGDPAAAATRLDRVESQLGSSSGQAIYTELVSVYQTIEASAGICGPTSRTAAGPPSAPPPAAPSTSAVPGSGPGGVPSASPVPASGPACTVESLLQTTCAGVCRGAVVLLGVVSGGPDCQACLDRGCR